MFLIKKIFTFILFFLVFISFLTCSSKKIKFDTVAVTPPEYWPTKEWRASTPEKQGMKSEKLIQLFKHIEKNKIAIDNITIVRNGYVVTDAYFYPFNKNKKHILHSVTKSITSAIVGIAVDKGFIKSVHEPVLGFFPDKEFDNIDDRKKRMTVEDLLTMRSGLDVEDSYRHNDKGIYELAMSQDWVQHTLDKPMRSEPGTDYYYSMGSSFLLSAIVQQSTKITTLDFGRKHLFGPLGIKDIEWALSPQEIYIGSSDMWLKPHDMAKIGLLYLNKGKWGTRQIISKSWVEASVQPHTKERLYDYYGYQWRIDNAGYYLASGRYGQNIFVVPEKNMVVVFTSDMKPADYYTTNDLMNDYIVPAAVSTKAIASDKKASSRLSAMIKKYGKGPEGGYVWLSKDEGVITNNTFIRKASPSFKFKIPDCSKKIPLEAPGMIMNISSPLRIKFQASIIDIPEDIELSDFGEDIYAQALREIGSDVKVVSNYEIGLNDGTDAYKTLIMWKVSGVSITTAVIAAYKKGKCVFIAAHNNFFTSLADPFLETLTFKL